MFVREVVSPEAYIIRSPSFISVTVRHTPFTATLSPIRQSDISNRGMMEIFISPPEK